MKAGHAKRPKEETGAGGKSPGQLVSLWPVRDALARRFMTALYDHLWRGETIRDALWAAKLSLINADPGGYADPYARAA